MKYVKWFIVSMISTLMIVGFMPWTALLFLDLHSATIQNMHRSKFSI